MKLSNALAPVNDLRVAISAATLPTLRFILRSPSLLFHPSVILRYFFSHVWVLYGPGIDEGGREVKKSLIPPYARGIVLDIGAGHGHTVKYLDKSKVTKYVPLEPNKYLHDEIRKNAKEFGFSEASGTLVILDCGASDFHIINSALGGVQKADTITSILTLCTIPDPEGAIQGLCNSVLAPGGQFLYYEHVLSHREDVRWWQRLWTPFWSLVFDGCRLDRPSDITIRRAQDWDWSTSNTWGKPSEDEENIWWHQAGVMVKRSNAPSPTLLQLWTSCEEKAS